MPQKTETGMDRLRKITWLQWGLITIVAGLMTGALGSIQGAPKNGAEAAGRAAAVLLFIAVGVVFIIVHFVRPKRSGKKTVKNSDEVRTQTRQRPAGVSPSGLPPRRPGAKR